MDVFTMVVIIVIVACATGVATQYLENQKKRADDASEYEASDLSAELDRLRARVEVLEKIVTDEKYQLQKQINEL